LYALNQDSTLNYNVKQEATQCFGFITLVKSDVFITWNRLVELQLVENVSVLLFVVCNMCLIHLFNIELYWMYAINTTTYGYESQTELCVCDMDGRR